MPDPDRRTTIDGDQITDDTISPSELKKSNSPDTTNKFVTVDPANLDQFLFVPEPSGSGVFGTEFQYAENNVVFGTTSTSFINRLDFDTASLVGGTYKIEWSYGWNHDSSNNDFLARIVLDNDTDINDLLMYHRQEPKDSSGTGQDRYLPTLTDQVHRSSGYRVVTLTAGVHNIKFDLATLSSGVESAVWDLVICLYRVS